jgi:hypothetical protein
VAFGIFETPSPIWSDYYCGRDNGFGLDPVCGILGEGYKHQYRLFVCTFEQVPAGMTSGDTGVVAEPVDDDEDDDDEDDDDEEIAPSP